MICLHGAYVGVQIMKKEAFTATRVEGYKCEPGKSQTIFWDAKVPGLGLRVTPSGARSYIYESRLFGKTVRVTIGAAQAAGLAKARTEASRLRTLVDDGKDPREVRAQEGAAHAARRAESRRKSVTFAEAWDAYLRCRKPRWSERHYDDHVQHAAEGGRPKARGHGVTIAGPLAMLRPLKLPELTGDRIAHWLQLQTVDRPTMAALSYRLLRAFIRWAAETTEYRDAIPADAYKARVVKDAVPRVKAKEGDVLQREQLRAWFAAVRKTSNPVIAAYLQALLITGARREELAGLKWADVDFQWRSLSIADKVEDLGRMVPLTPYVASLLEALPRRNEWVFSSLTASDGKIAEPRLAHNAALTAAGLPHVSLHGLRRSFGTLSEWLEAPVGVVAQIMGHKPSAIAEKHYRRRPLDLLRLWHDRIEAWLLKEAAVEFDAKATTAKLRAV
jgi:integrase